ECCRPRDPLRCAAPEGLAAAGHHLAHQRDAQGEQRRGGAAGQQVVRQKAEGRRQKAEGSMKRLLTYVGAGVMAVLTLPAAADAQVYPERLSIAVKARAIVEAAHAYQRRSRDDNREEQTERTTKVVKL